MLYDISHNSILYGSEESTIIKIKNKMTDRKQKIKKHRLNRNYFYRKYRV